MERASAGRGDEARDARQAVYEGLPQEEKILFLDVLTRELERHGDEDAAWAAAWRAVEDPHVSGASDPKAPARAALDTTEPEFPEIQARRRFDLEWHVRRAREAGIPLPEALRHAEEDLRDRHEADPLPWARTRRANVLPREPREDEGLEG